MALTQEQRNTLSILGYLYYRMGRLDNAATVFAALDKLAPEGMDAISRRAAATLAAIETDRGNAEKALQLLHRVMDGQTLSTRHAALHLLRYGIALFKNVSCCHFNKCLVNGVL